jgi:hypothetical protein
VELLAKAQSSHLELQRYKDSLFSAATTPAFSIG